LDPGGEIWINGEIVALQKNRHPGAVDISSHLKPDQDNLVALKVYPNKVEHTNRHTVSDLHTGWFSGRMHIDFTAKKYIQDLFTYTRSLEPTKQEIRIKLTNEDWQFEENEMKQTREFNGQLLLEFFPWYPEESAEPVASKVIPVYLHLMKEEELVTEVTIPQPELWSPKRPFLYKVVATLKDQENKPVDDFVITTGIRTISQEGGTFRLNGKPAMMNGALLFGYKSPLDKIAQWLRAGPEEWLVKEILMIKNMNANTIRMSIHHGMKGGVNDPRMAEIGDQLGVMFQWTTGTWVRTGSPWLLDFDGLPKYVRQVRNHPSIVMWQPGNHPKFVDFDTETIPWYQQVYQKIYPNDPSRLINPAANNTRLMGRNDEGTLDRKGNQVKPEPIWTAPMITRGDMDHATGYGTEWSTLRMYPFPPEWSGEQGWRSAGYRTDYLNSTERAYFDFESEESAGQPNWTLRKGKPSYQIKSYELKYDEGSIGRQLTVDEWELSQAWQAFSGFEAYKKKRWLDYDGLAWCPLHGGGNTATYQKPLIDFYGYAKLGFHAIKMAFQPTLAGSHNVDMVYGPDDQVKPVIVHIGDKKRVNLHVVIEDTNGKNLANKEYKNVQLAAGRSSQELEPFKPRLKKEGFYVVKYKIEENQ
jgi:beta-galactosidase/beta-glucuronidase